MKLYKLSILALALAGVMAACDDKDTYEPGAPSAGVYFPNTNKSAFEVTGDEDQVTFPVMRSEGGSAATYELTVTYPEDADWIADFTVPTSVSFAEGQKEADLTVKFDKSKIAFNTKYTITFAIADNEANIYGAQTYNCVITKPETWQTLGWSQYTEDFLTTFFNVDNLTYYVQIQECEQAPGKYRLVNPYGAAYPYNEPGDYDTKSDHYMVINATNPDEVYIEGLFKSGMDWGYGEFMMTSMAYYYLNQGVTAEEIAAEGLFGQMKDGVITMPAESLLVAMADYNNGGLYPSGNNGLFRVVLPGYYSTKDYTSAVEYQGLFIDADGTSSYAVAKVQVGGDATIARAGVVASTNVESAYDAVMAGAVKTTEFAAGTNTTAYFELPGSGEFTLALITYDGDEVVDKNSATFVVSGGGVPEKGNWKSLGNAEYYDGWLLPGFTADGEPINPFEWGYYVEIEENQDTPGIYRLVNPYVGNTVPLGQLNLNTKTSYVVIDATDPDFVIVEKQYSGFSADGFFRKDGKNEQIWIADQDWVYVNMGGNSKEEIIMYNANSTLVDGVIDILIPFFGEAPTVQDSQFGYTWGDPDEGIDPYPVEIVLPEAQAQKRHMIPMRMRTPRNVKYNPNAKKLAGRVPMLIRTDKGTPLAPIKD